ncbi:MAG: DUF86 domain-containing protein [Thermoprotei archaeon]|nr:DUF86 domain-containing protein [Thermoprotei archaeon]
MIIYERIAKQTELIEDLLRELSVETSYRGIERLVQLVIQALLDMGLMAISALGAREPKAYSEIGYILYELGIIGERDAEILRSMAGLRNILVHSYARVDRGKIVGFSKKLRDDALRIANTILKSVREKNIDPKEEGLGEIISKLSRVLKGRVEAAYLFGGRAKGYVLKGDFDIAVLMRENYSLYELGEIHVLVAKALGVGEGKVNIVCLNNAPPELVLEALKGIPITNNIPEKTFSMKLKALTELLDLKENMNVVEKKIKP